MRTLILLLLVCSAAGLQAGPELTYVVRMPAPWTHYLDVELRVDDWKDKHLDLNMAVWTPGSYLVREYAGNVDGMTAEGTDGKPLPIDKLDKNTWRIEPGKAETIVVRYSVYCFEHSVRTPFVDADHASIIPAGVFVWPADYDLPSTVRIEPYRDWKRVDTALEPVGGNPWVRRAEGRDHLLDCPIEIGNQERIDFTAAGIDHRIVIAGPGNYDSDRLVEDIRAVAEATTAIFGDNPNDDYLFILHNTENGYGGLEHMNSTSLIYRRAGYQDPARYRVFMSLVAHEYFHIWNVKRIRPEGLATLDYEGENYTDALWVMEGFTSYYDDLIVRRAGIMTEDDYLRLAAGNINSVNNRAGDRVQPVADASFDAWIKYYRQNENSGNTTVHYYGKGAVLAMLLDLDILASTKGKKRLDDVMRKLWADYKKKPERGFTDAELQKMLEKLVGHDLDDFFADYVYGTERIDYAAWFDRIGVEVVDDYSGIGPVRIGAAMGSDNVVTRVVRGLPAYEGGLSVQDEILAIDGQRVRGRPQGLHFGPRGRGKHHGSRQPGRARAGAGNHRPGRTAQPLSAGTARRRDEVGGGPSTGSGFRWRNSACSGHAAGRPVPDRRHRRAPISGGKPKHYVCVFNIMLTNTHMLKSEYINPSSE